MNKLTIKYEEHGVITEKTVSDVDNLHDICFHLTDFLRGCGFVFDGEVKIVNHNEQSSEDINEQLEFDLDKE